MGHEARIRKLAAAFWAAECARIDGLSTEALQAESAAEQEGLVRQYGHTFVHEFLTCLDSLSLDEHTDLVSDPRTFATKMSVYLDRWRRCRFLPRCGSHPWA